MKYKANFPSVKHKYHKKQHKPLRLTVVTQFFPPDYAATGQLIQELAAYLGTHNIQPQVFTGQPGYAFSQANAPNREITSEQVRIRRTRTTRFWSKRVRGKTLNGVLFCLRAILHVLKHRREIDILLLTTAPPFLSVIGFFANLFFGIPYVCLIYDLYPDVVTELGVSDDESLIVKTWHWVNRLVWQKAQNIIVLSSTMEERLLDKHPYLIDKVVEIHNWADAQKIQPLDKKDNWFAQEYQTDEKFTVLYSGNLGRCHDAETILATVELLKDEPIQFVFIGAGAKYEDCLEKVSAMGIDNCRFLPYQPKEVLPYSLTSADLALVSIAPGLEGVVVPSKVYGVMAAGVAIAAICEPHSYLQDLLNGGGFGTCFNNNDAARLADFIRHLAANPKKATAMGYVGREYLLSNFTPKITARKYAEVLQVNKKPDIGVDVRNRSKLDAVNNKVPASQNLN